MGGDDQVGTAGDAALLLAKAAVVALERRIEAGYKLTQVDCRNLAEMEALLNRLDARDARAGSD